MNSCDPSASHVYDILQNLNRKLALFSSGAMIVQKGLKFFFFSGIHILSGCERKSEILSKSGVQEITCYTQVIGCKIYNLYFVSF